MRFWRALFLLSALLLFPTQALPNTMPILKVGMLQEPDSLHPMLSTMSVALHIRHMLMSPIVALNEHNERQCWLCTTLPSLKSKAVRWMHEGGRKKLLVTWEIRPDAFWGDGMPVVGADMRLAWEIGTTSTIANPTPESFSGVEDVLLDLKKPRQFTLKFKEPRYDALDIDVSFVPLPSHIEGHIFAKTKSVPGAYEKATAYVTSPQLAGLYNGPYRIKDIVAGDHVLLERNPRAKNPAPQFEQLLFKLIPNPGALIAHLESGAIDMTAPVGGITGDQALEFEKRLEATPALKKRFKVSWFDNLVVERVVFNLEENPMNELAVRQALTLAVDRQLLCDGLFDGRYGPITQPYHPASSYYVEELFKSEDVRSHKAKAERLLDQAGWRRGESGLRQKGGKPLALTIMSMSQNRQREAIEIFLQKSWSDIGIKLTIQNQPARTFYGETLRHRRYGSMALYANALTTTEDILFSMYHSQQVPRATNGWSGSNNAGWGNPRVDAALNAAQISLDQKDRKAKLRSVTQDFLQDVPILPLFKGATAAIVPVGFRVKDGDFPFSLLVSHWTLGKPALHP